MKRTVSGITLTLLLIGMLTLAFNVRLLKVAAGTITVPDDYLTIQEAINVAEEGDMICVKVGTYYEHVVMNKTLSLIGENRDTTIIDGNGTGTVVHVQANNTVISNFVVQNSGDGGSGVYLDCVTNSTIRNVTATYTNAGIRLSSSPSCYIYENIVYESDHGILLFDSPFCYVCCNVIKKIYAYGIRLVSSAYSSVNNNHDAKIYLFHSPHCAVCSNIGVDIKLSSSSHCSVSGNKAHQIWLDESRNNNLTLNNCTYFCVEGDYNNYVDTSNTVYGKPIYYLIDVADAIYGPETNAGTIYLINSKDITVRNLMLTKNYCGVLLWNTTNSKIENVTTSNNDNGIILECSNNNTVVDDCVLNNESGISLSFSNNNTIIGNTFSSNYYGIWLGNSRNNLIIQNKVINNTRHVYSFAYVGYPPSVNIWDDGYPSGGNYWSDHVCTGNPSDGSQPYIIDANNIDHYPFQDPNGWLLHRLTVTSSPIAGITFTINGDLQTTPYTEWLPEGSYTLEMPQTHNGYVWSHWLEDGDLNRTKTITLSGTTWTGVFVFGVEPHDPEAEFEAIPDTASTGESIKFDASASLPGWNGTHEMLIIEYRWDFGDRNKTTTFTPIVYHSFQSAGIYYVTLTVYAPGATPETDSTTKKVTITAIPVGGYSFPIKGYTTTKLLRLYLALVAILAASFTIVKRRKKQQS